MATTFPPIVEQLQSNINLINQVLNTLMPGDPEIPGYRSLLVTLGDQLAGAERDEDLRLGSNTIPTSYLAEQQVSDYNMSPISAASTAPPSRKRSLGLTGDGSAPDPKRVSGNPSPLTPGTPDSFFDAPTTEQRYSLPSRPAEVASSGSSMNQGPWPVIDLTISEPPSPDPFPELFTAFCDDGARPEPADAFNLDFMGHDELAEFLMRPTPANGGYGFQQQNQHGDWQQQQQHQQANAVDYAHGFDFPARDVPYLSGPQRQRWMPQESDNEDNYGEFPMTLTEANAIEKMLETIEKNGDDTQNDREQTPQIMSSTLKEYQKIGLTWLMKMETGRNSGGILADEMGLGKTVQALALICARPSEDPLCKTTLIIAPVALMRQWENEIATHVKSRHRLSVFLYWGKGKRADFNLLRQYDVVLTTFGTLTSEFKQKESRRESMLYEREQREPEFRRKAADRLALLGPECMWYRIIMDEAHAIKNRNSIASKASVDLQAHYRLCLTGTPMMNSIDELYPLLRFLRVDRYSDWKLFSLDIAKPAKHPHPQTRKQAVNRVQILLKTVMLRRQKTSEVDGKPILTLPPKHTTIDNVEFSDDEHAIYKALEASSQIQFNKYVKHNTVSANYACILVLLLRLRQACCHPHLIQDLSQPATEGISEDDLLERARYLPEDVVNRLKDFDSFECPICLEADPNPTIIIPCGHTVCGECVQKLVDPSRPGQDSNDEASSSKCPQCRGELHAKLITDFKHFCRVHCPDRLDPDDRVEVEPSDSEDEESDEDEDNGVDVDENGDLAGFVVPDDDDNEDSRSENGDTKSNLELSAQTAPKKVTKKNKGKGKARAQPKKTLAQLKKESLRSKADKKKYLRRLEKTWVPSAKILQIVEIVNNIRKNDPTEKTLIFSQFTSLLDLVEVPLLKQKFRYQRYDGSMSMDARADAVEAFMENPDENIMLVSLKAGNAGLNLWRASQVILLDPFWNPFVEDQAVDRAHRMPQEREVTVHRVLVPETVEDRICALQDKKRDIIGAALDENASKGLARLNVRELKFLFGLG
ncbi:SNF2 family N-terminal domain-containing protein [Phaeosphaeriaceae sp. PMI808]|nr:SNF2 family N-terminal domain-containing protein [Phaeosphaeriaceae sp. PMI808]